MGLERSTVPFGPYLHSFLQIRCLESLFSVGSNVFHVLASGLILTRLTRRCPLITSDNGMMIWNNALERGRRTKLKHGSFKYH